MTTTQIEAKFNMKKKLSEDIELTPPSYEGQDIGELYEIQGAELFNEENIPYLKQAGLIDDYGYPIEKYEGWSGETIERPMTLLDVYNLDSGFIDSPYIKQLFLQEINNKFHFDDEGNCNIIYYVEYLPDTKSRDMSRDFLEACFSEDVWDYFTGYGEYSFNDCRYILDDISDEVLDLLEKYGFPRNIYEQLVRGEADDDSPLSKWYGDLEMALVSAYTRGQEDGSAAAALDDFNRAFRESMPEGVTWIEQETTDSQRPLKVSKSFIDNNIKSIWRYIDTYSEDAGDAAIEYLKEMINENLLDNFSEPRYGWNDFDSEVFSDCLLDNILELDIPEEDVVDIRGPEQEEQNLLNYDGETNEYHEDLDVVEVDSPDKPEKLFYKYKEYNKELSSKAYRLNFIMVNELLKFLHNPENRGYVDALDLRYLEPYAETDDARYVILSKIKPSYLPTYGGDGYTIWIDEDDYYGLRYIGWIPKHIGDKILSMKPIDEDLSIDVIPVPDIDVGPKEFIDGHSVEELEDIISNEAFADRWILQSYEDGEYNLDLSFQPLSQIYNKYMEWQSPNKEDWIQIVYIPEIEDVEDGLMDGSYVICGRYGGQQ